MRRRRWSAGLLLVVIANVVAAGCTTTVSGHGQPASVSESAPRFSATTDPTATASPTTTVSAATTTVAIPTKATPTRATRAQLDAELARLAPG